MKIPWAKPSLTKDDENSVARAVHSQWISDGEYIGKFESHFAESIGASHLLTTSNGTTALQLAYLALGIGPGDEVIVPNMGFIAPTSMALSCGATPVLTDVDPQTWCLDAKSVEANITEKTKAIVPIHTYGSMADMGALLTLAKKHQIPIIEDAAEACFSQWDGQEAGTLGDFGCFSFQATKTITMGEGGAVAFKTSEQIEKLKLLRSHGMEPSKKYWHKTIGYNFRLTNMQAALGFSQLQRKSEIIEKRDLLYCAYRERFSQQSDIQMQTHAKSCEPVVWAFGLRLEKGHRDQMIDQLKTIGIETRPGFYCASRMPAFDQCISHSSLTTSEKLSDELIALPFFFDLEIEQIDYIFENFNKMYGQL